MQAIFDMILPFHILMGVLSLVLFWVPVFSKKGGMVHKKSGKGFVWAMWLVLITSVLLCIIRCIQGHHHIASFLAFISLITAQPLWYGIAVLRSKERITPRMITIRRVLLWSIMLAGLGMLVASFVLPGGLLNTLMMIFGILGLLSGRKAFWSDEAFQSKYYWLIDHIDGMITSGIAAYTAFFAFGGRTMLAHWLEGQWQVLPWVLPTVIGVISIRTLKKKILQGD